MELQEAVTLIQTKEIVQEKQTVWADLGCGSGLFTRALSGQLHTGSTIYAIDNKISAFQNSSVSNDVIIKTLQSDFVHDDLHLQDLDGILMANALHFVRNKKQFIEKVTQLFRSVPVFLLVEYDTDTPNPWVPFPLSFTNLKKLFTDLGFHSVKKISEKKSLYRSGKMYSVLITY
jgi:hypothetical protein